MNTTLFNVGSSDCVEDNDLMKILIASDIHLGFSDGDIERENDSFNTFEEILQLAVEKEVDFMLLGGDLFHHNKPKPHIMQRTMELLQKYCLGQRLVQLEYHGDPKIDFPKTQSLNYYDPNINISLPVFSIHGNHDDPIGATKLSAIDHLSTVKLINHFGQWESLNQVCLRPVLLSKGKTKLALYGLGNMRDERLYRLLRDRQVTYVMPRQSREDADYWFKLLVLHQNRTDRKQKNHIPEDFIQSEVDIVLWGHEHECRIDPEPTSDGTSFIIQPGSPVATSLCGGEAKEKHVAVLNIYKKSFQVDKIKLKTVRPFVMKDVDVRKFISTHLVGKGVPEVEHASRVQKYICNEIDRCIEDADDQLTGHPKQPILPLIRVRAVHESIELFKQRTLHPSYFTENYYKKIANEDIVVVKNKNFSLDPLYLDVDDLEEMIEAQGQDASLDSHVEEIVEEHFKAMREKQDKDGMLEVLSERGMSNAISEFVTRDNPGALEAIINHQVETTCQYLRDKNVDEENIEEMLERFREIRYARTVEEENLEAMRAIKDMKSGFFEDNGNHDGEINMTEKASRASVHDEIPEDDVDIDEGVTTNTRGKRGRGRGRSRGRATSTRGTRRGRGRSGSASRGRGRGVRSSSNADDSEEDVTHRISPRSTRQQKESFSSNSRFKQTTLKLTTSSSATRARSQIFDSDSDSD